MVTDIITNNAAVLEKELEWFYTILDTRIKLNFGHECEHEDIFEIIPPELDPEESVYGNLINHYDMTIAERIIFVLSLVPHVRPQLLDVFFTKNSANSMEFTEFGRRNGYSYSGFLPTGETAMFILAGNDLEARLHFRQIFNADHFFNRHSFISLEGTESNESDLSGFMILSKEIVDLITTGSIREPIFGTEFPAKKIDTQLDWESLMLDPFTMSQVLEIKTWIEYGDKLLNELDLGKKIKPGYRSIFYGKSGTGKTFTASLLGKVTDRSVYRIDLSLIVSKYIGETEKNLEKVFKKAENKNWILFFDEADALFGKRTNISNAHDRFANQEIAYLLQRVEDYAGVVILATNMKSNLDEAFTRRFQSIIHFPMPREEERYKIWDNAFSPKLKPGEDVNLNEIAANYELSGGSIMNVVGYATLMALKNSNEEILTDDIIRGINKEFQKEGRTH